MKQNNFGQLVLRQKLVIISNLKDNRSQWIHRIQKLAEISISQICSSVTSSENPTAIAIPLRIAEEFTSLSTYATVLSEPEANRIVSSVWLHLVKNKFFSKLRLIIDIKVPEPYEETITPSTPLSRTLIDLALRPLNQSFEKNTATLLVVRHFFNQMISGPFSAQIKYLVFPILIDQQPSNLNPVFILNSLVDASSQKLTVSESVWTLYGVTKLVASNLSLLANEEKILYLTTLKLLSDVFPDVTAKSEDDDDTEYAMEYTEYSNVPGYQNVGRIVQEVLEIINLPSNVQVFVSMTENSESSSDALDSLSCLCYAMISCHRHSVNHFR